MTPASTTFQPGQSVRILLGRQPRVGKVVGHTYAECGAYRIPRVVVEVDGVKRSYLPSSLRVVECDQ